MNTAFVRRFIVVFYIFALLVTAPGYGATNVPTVDIVGCIVYFTPGDDTYKPSPGLEGQIRLWAAPDACIVLTLDIASWKVEKQDAYLRGNFSDAYVTMDGKTTLLGLGAGLGLRPIHTPEFQFLIEGGLKYYTADSDVQVTIDAHDYLWGRSDYLQDKYDIGAGVVGYIAGTLELRPAPNVSLVGSLGYQVDLIKGDLKIFNETFTGEHELKALTLRAGLSITL